jgi:hypothetical protein
MSVTPGTAAGGQAGQNFVFTFIGGNAANYGDGSLLQLVVPTGWTTPQISSSTAPGFVSVANGVHQQGPQPWGPSDCLPGTVSTSGQVITVSPIHCGNNMTFTITYANVTPPVANRTDTFRASTLDPGSNNPVLTELRTSPTVNITVAASTFTVTLWVRTCIDYAHVPSNYERDVNYGGSWGGNDNGHHNLDLGTFYGSPSTAPNTDSASGYTVTSTDAALCEASSGVIGLYAGQDARHNGSGATLQRAVSVGTGGSVISLTAAELALANAGTYSGGLFFSETNQADFSPEFTLNQNTGFADIRCWTDIHYSDNSEEIYNRGSSTSAVCVAYNVKPKLTWTSTVPTNAYVGGPTYTAAATSTGNTANRDLSPIQYSSETPSVCTVNANSGVVTFVGVGTCTIDANQAMQPDSSTSSPFWAAAAQIQLASFTVKAAPTIATTLSATSVAIGASVHDSASLTGATPNAGGTVTYTVYTNSTCTSGAQSAGTVTVTNGSVPNSSDLSFANAGTYYWQAVYSGDTDNNGATSPCLSEILTVNRNALTITALGQSKTYGTAYTLQTGPTTYSVTGVPLPGDSITGVTLTATGAPSGLGASDPAGGTYPIHPSNATGSFNPNNYTITYVDGLLTVNKAPSVVAVTCPGSVAWTGSAQTPCSATVTGVGGLNESVPVDYLDDHTSVGTAHVSATFAGDANHTGDSDTGSFDIVAATVTCTVTPYHETYDGVEHQATGSCLDSAGNPVSGLDLSGTRHTAAGTYTDGWTFSAAGYASQSDTITDQIDLAPLTITANDRTKTYGQTVTFAGTEFTTSGLLGSDTVTSVTLTSAGAAAGATVAGSPYPITPSAAVGTGLSNYDITYVDGSLTVNLAPLTITANSTSKTYGQTVSFTGTEFTTSGLLGSDTVTSVTLTSAGTAAGATVASSPYPITPSAAVGTGLSNYDITYVDGLLTVNRATASCSVSGYTATYDGLAHTATGTCTGVDGETLSGLDLTATTHTPAGTYTDGWTFSNPNYEPQRGTVTDIINLAPLTITANSTSKTYGQTVSFTGTEFTTSGLLGSDTVTSVTLTSAGAAAGATVAGSPYPIAPSAAVGTGLSNYDITYVDGLLTVNKAPSVVAVTCPGSVAWTGSAQTPCSATVTGVGGLNESVPVDYLDDHTSVGTAHVSATFAGDANHTGDSDTGSFDIVAATVTCTVTPYHETYDGVEHQATGSCLDSAGNPVSGLDLSGTRHTAAGTYTDGWTFSAAGYASQSDTITDQIDLAPLTITANDRTKTYGQTVTFAGTEFTTSGLLGSDTVTSVTLTSAGAAAGATVAGSPYPIAPSAAVGTGLSNYDITYVDGSLTVNLAPLTITANNQTKTYGQTVSFAGTEFTPSGLQNGETIGSATITSTGAGSGAAVGSYPITISDATGGTFTPANYTITYVPGTLTVTARPVLVVTPDDQTRVRGAANPVFTYTITGFIDGDDKSDLTPAPTCTTTADASSPVGTYPITCSGGDTSKYDYDYRPGTLTVTAKPVLHVTANSLSKNQGDPNPTLTYTITGFIDGDDESDLTSPVTCTTTATDSSPAGTYPITCTGAASEKYAITYTAGVLTVVGEEVGGETEAPGRSPTPPPTTAVDSPLENSIPLIGFLICLAFGAIGLLAVQAQRRTRRLR